MNYKIDPRHEYQKLLKWYSDPDSPTDLPDELIKLEEIYNFCYPLLNKGYLNQKTIAKLLKSSPVGIKYKLSLSVCVYHVGNATEYYCESQLESSEVHRLRLSKLLYKQIEILESIYEDSPIKAASAIKDIIAEIAKLNKCYDPKPVENDVPNEVTFVLSDNAKEIPSLAEANIDDEQLFSLVEQFSRKYDITDVQKERIINKDIHGEI